MGQTIVFCGLSGCEQPAQGNADRPFLQFATAGSRITLTDRSNTIQVTTKGQVTIPLEIRNRLGLLPHTEVEFELAGDHARIRKAQRASGGRGRGRLVIEALRGTANTGMSTDEIMALMRGEPRPTKRRK